MSNHPPTLPEPTALRDCPFCGQEGPGKDDDFFGARFVRCDACGATGPRHTDLATARALWNASPEAVLWFWEQP